MIIILDSDPYLAASYLCVRHRNAIQRSEAALIIANVFERKGIRSPRKGCKRSTRNQIDWAEESISNFNWVLEFLKACISIGNRPDTESEVKLKDFVRFAEENKDKLGLPDIGLTPFPWKGDEGFKHPSGDTILSYRNYYSTSGKVTPSDLRNPEYKQPVWMQFPNKKTLLHVESQSSGRVYRIIKVAGGCLIQYSEQLSNIETVKTLNEKSFNEICDLIESMAMALIDTNGLTLGSKILGGKIIKAKKR